MNPESKARAEELLALIGQLLAAIDGAGARSEEDGRTAIAESAAVVLRYRDILADGLTTDDARRALQGANLAAGVNKGLTDVVWVDGWPDVESAGKRVSDHALATARLLRADLGMDF